MRRTAGFAVATPFEERARTTRMMICGGGAAATDRTVGDGAVAHFGGCSANAPVRPNVSATLRPVARIRDAWAGDCRGARGALVITLAPVAVVFVLALVLSLVLAGVSGGGAGGLGRILDGDDFDLLWLCGGRRRVVHVDRHDLRR